MFDVEVNEFSSKEVKLLKNIEKLLIEQNALMKSQEISKKQNISLNDNTPKEKSKAEFKPSIETMNRNELIATIKTLPKGTIKGKYMTMGIDELRKQVKEAI